jgi:RNA polymerase sigma factor (sigma-70 family)
MIRAVVNRLLLTRRLSDVQIERDDLYQIAWLVLLRCLKTFDKNRGVKFDTYFGRSVHRAINRELEHLYNTQMEHMDEEDWLEIEDTRAEDMIEKIIKLVRDNDKFTQDERIVFWAHFLYGDSFEAAGARINKCGRTANRLYKKVIVKLQELMTHE